MLSGSSTARTSRRDATGVNVQNIRATDAGVYSVVVSNPTARSSAIGALSVDADYPRGSASGQTARPAAPSLQRCRCGTPPLTYQWRFNGGSIPERRLRAIRLATSKPATGSYSVEVRNVAGSTTAGTRPDGSHPAVDSIPAVEPNVALGVTFTMTATGGPPLSYQWQKNGQTIGGATSASLTLAMRKPTTPEAIPWWSRTGRRGHQRSASLTLILPQVRRTSREQRRRRSKPGSTFDGGRFRRRAACSRGGTRRRQRRTMVLLKAPANGIVTFNTAGSTFDTVLHLTGTPPSNLTRRHRR